MIGPIEKGVPAPSRATGTTAALREMEVGDSRVFSGPRPSAIIAAVMRSTGMRFVTKQEDDGTRVWRVE